MSCRTNNELPDKTIPSFSQRSKLIEQLQRVKRPKPHQPRFETETCNLSNQQDESPLFIFPVTLENNVSATTLLDSGASKEFISSDFVKKYNLPVQPLSNKLRIILADGRTVVATQQCLVTFTVNSTQFVRTCVVINMNISYDIILGMSFFFDVNPSIDWSKKTWHVSSMPSLVICTSQSRDVSLNIISANAMARLKKNKTLLLNIF